MIVVGAIIVILTIVVVATVNIAMVMIDSLTPTPGNVRGMQEIRIETIMIGPIMSIVSSPTMVINSQFLLLRHLVLRTDSSNRVCSSSNHHTTTLCPIKDISEASPDRPLFKIECSHNRSSISSNNLQSSVIHHRRSKAMHRCLACCLALQLPMEFTTIQGLHLVQYFLAFLIQAAQVF